MTAKEVVLLAKKNRKNWHVEDGGFIRTSKGKRLCPIEAAARVAPGRYWLGMQKLGLRGSIENSFLEAADDYLFKNNFSKSLRKFMERELLAK